jgi:hypothetical protein
MSRDNRSSNNIYWNDRYDFIEEGLQYLHFNDKKNRDAFKIRAAIEKEETKVADDAIASIESRQKHFKDPKFRSYDMDRKEKGSVVDARIKNEDYDEKKHNILPYRFGKALQAFETSECPTTYQYTPIMYDKRDTKQWPWDENEKYEDPIVSPRSGHVYCCNKQTNKLDLMYVNTKKNLFSRDYKDYPNCNADRYIAYKAQETRFVNYINEYTGLNYTIFKVIDLLTNEVKKENLDTIFLVLQTYNDFFREPLRLSFFDECVCRGNEGHANIQKQIGQIKQVVSTMLSNYRMKPEEQDEIIGGKGILTNLDLYINTQNPKWKENTLKALRRWLSFNMRIEKRIKDEGKDEGKKVKLSEQPFYKIIKYVIQYLLKHLQKSTDAIPLLQLMPNMEKSEPNAPMISFNDINFDAVLSYLIKDKSSLDLLLALGSRLKLGLDCDAKQIYNLFIRLARSYPKDIAKLLLRNLLRENGDKCKEDLENYLDKYIKAPIIQLEYDRQPEEFRRYYKENYTREQKDEWKKQAFLSYIEDEQNKNQYKRVKDFMEVLEEYETNKELKKNK